jgi:hypothetical protein
VLQFALNLELQFHWEKKDDSICTFIFWTSTFFFFYAVLGIELRAFTLSHSTSPFLWSVFEIGSHELFAQTGFWSLLPE